MRIMKIHLGIVSENRTPSTDLHRDFGVGISPLQLGVVACLQTHTQTDTHTHTHTYTHTHTHTHTHRVTTEGTLSGFQDFFLQPIIKDRPNIIMTFIYNVTTELCTAIS